MRASSRGFGELIARLRAGAARRRARRHREHGRGRRAARRARRAARRRRPCSATCRRRSTTRRGSSGRRRARRPSRSRSSRRGSARSRQLAPYAELPGSGAAGGLGAALASLGAELVAGRGTPCSTSSASTRARYDLVVTGEGRVDATTAEGKAPAEVVRRCGGGRRAVRRLRRASSRAPLARRRDGRALRRPRRAQPTTSLELGLRLGTRLLDAAG